MRQSVRMSSEFVFEMIRSLVNAPGYSRGLRTFYAKDYQRRCCRFAGPGWPESSMTAMNC